MTSLQKTNGSVSVQDVLCWSTRSESKILFWYQLMSWFLKLPCHSHFKWWSYVCWLSYIYLLNLRVKVISLCDHSSKIAVLCTGAKHLKAFFYYFFKILFVFYRVILVAVSLSNFPVYILSVACWWKKLIFLSTWKQSASVNRKPVISAKSKSAWTKWRYLCIAQ